MSARTVTIQYNDKVVRQFLLASVLWGAVGMLVGVIVATQLNALRTSISSYSGSVSKTCGK